MLFADGRWKILGRKVIEIGRRFVPLVPLVVLFIVTEFRGIDFGEQRDELDGQINPVRDMVNTGLLLPRAAIYPAFSRWLVLLPAVFRGLVKALAVGPRPLVIHAAMQQVVAAPEYVLAARRSFVVVSALALVWVYAAALVLGRRSWEALIAAATLGLSWEYAYHARWVAPDAVAVQFCALALALLLAFLRFGRVNLLYAAAIGAGLATGTSFVALPLLFAVIVCGASKLSPYRWRAQLGRAMAVFGTAVSAFVLTTPASVLEPFKFVQVFSPLSPAHVTSHHASVPGWDELRTLSVYFATSYFSPYRVVSMLLAFGVVGGAVALLRQNRRFGALLVGFPLLYVSLLCFLGSAATIGNGLLLAPFFALLLAWGIGALVDALPRVVFRALVFAGLGGVAVVNGAFLVSAAESIRHRDIEAAVGDALAYARGQPSSSFGLSPRVRSIASERKLELPRLRSVERADRVVFVVPAEGPDAAAWPPNDPSSVERVFGPRDVNLTWYPTWTGSEHSVVMTRSRAHALRVPFLR
jgi:hypothetical protein